MIRMGLACVRTGGGRPLFGDCPPLEALWRIVCGLLLLAGGLAYTPAEAAGSPSAVRWLSVSGHEFVDDEGACVALRGIQFDFGSVRGDAALNEADPGLADFLDRIIDYSVTEEDVRIAKEMGASVARLSLTTYKDFEGGAAGGFREANFLKLDRVVQWAETYKLYLILSMRQSPGGHNSSPHSGEGGNALWANAEYRRRLADLWQEIARRYADRPIVVGYDLLNEPQAPDRLALNGVYSQLRKGIRSVDSRHIIFLEGNDWATNLSWIDPPTEANVALSIHFYEPAPYAVRGEGSYTADQAARDSLRSQLTSRMPYAESLNRPVYVGEFGAVTRAEGYLAYDGDVIALLEEKGLTWTYWNYKNVRGRSDVQSMYYPSSTVFSEFIDALASGVKFKDVGAARTDLALDSLRTPSCTAKLELTQRLKDALTRAPTPPLRPQVQSKLR